MKTLEKIAFTALLTLFSYGFTQAAPKPLKSMNQVLTTYIDCTTQGHLENLDDILGKDFRHTMNRNGNLFTVNKKTMIKFLQSTKNVRQNCETTYTIVEESQDCVIAKISLKYPEFTKVDYVTLCAGEEGWAVSQVVSTFP